ncbi:hypothetical protein HY631_04485 [Candidatus Uhrbacteria bacterium]|nr:hypothetical protein [Candidatus Uhrbacteria bacterium]
MLAALAGVRAPWWVLLALSALVLAALPVTLLVDAIVMFARSWRVARSLSTPEARCPRGHVVVLGPGAAWTCGACGYAYLGSGWGPCPRCGAVAAYVTCPCGLALDNPVFELLGSDDAR